MHSRLLTAAFAVFLSSAAVAQMPDKPIARPKITGVSHLAVYASDAAATDRFYRQVIGATKLPDPESPLGSRYAISNVQFIEVLPLPANAGKNRLDHIALNTDDAEGMRKFLSSKSWKVPGNVEKGADGSAWFTVADPEGNKVQFVQLPSPLKQIAAPNAVGRHIIHVGILVHNRALEDTFYRDLLGFRPYWYGGMEEGRIDWVSQQTPDAHDWVEYMMTHDGSTSGIPPAMSQETLGVLNHLSIGVPSVTASFKELQAAKRLADVRFQEPKIGRDGKYQLNLYDPDGTRVEMMDFHATEKPCCSQFTADDPAE